jgi:hypothetical protein
MRQEIIFKGIMNGGHTGSEFTFSCPVRGLPSIPRGANPRSPAKTAVVDSMLETLETDGVKFSNKNRGISLVVRSYRWVQSWEKAPDGSMMWDLHVDVTDPGIHTGVGHWDGGHTEYACGLYKSTWTSQGTVVCNANVRINLTTLECYKDVQEIRDCANSQNKIQRQKAWSEANLRGAFDGLKVRWARQFGNATVEYEQNEHPEGEEDYIVMSILKLAFALLENGENDYLGYGRKGKNPTHCVIAHSMAPRDVTDKFEQYKEQFEALPLEIWAMFADFVRMDIDKSHATTKVKEKLLDDFTGTIQTRSATLCNTHYARMIIHSGSHKRLDRLFSGEKLLLNAVDMNCVYPIVFAFAQRFMECDPEDGILWKDGKGRTLSDTADMAILDMLKRSWKKVSKDVLQVMVNEFNTNYPKAENSTNGFWPKTSSYFTQMRDLVVKTRKLRDMSINKKQKFWNNSAAESAWMHEQLKDLDVADWQKEEENG